MNISVSRAAILLGVSITTLRRWDVSGALKPSYFTTGGHRRYSLADLEAIFHRDPTKVSAMKTPDKEPHMSVDARKADLERRAETLQGTASKSAKQMRLRRVLNETSASTRT